MDCVFGQMVISRALVSLLLVGGASHGQVVINSISLHVDSHENAAPTPIQQEYLSLIRSAAGGDEIILLQKYFRNRAINQAIVDAAGRGVDVTGIYRDIVRPSCPELLRPGSSLDCDRMFIRRPHVHHKSMVLHRGNGDTSAIIGSYNLRERHRSSPRVHTALSFDVAADTAFFPFYKAHAEFLRGSRADAASSLVLATESGGKMALTFQPGAANPVAGLLAGISTCDGPLWLSYYRAVPDEIGEPIFHRLGDLATGGCDVRFLLDRDPDNHAAAKRLQSLDVTVRHPGEPAGPFTLGHKVVMVHSGDNLHLIQSSANLDRAHHRDQFNLTLYLTGNFPAIERQLSRVFSEYWSE